MVTKTTDDKEVKVVEPVEPEVYSMPKVELGDVVLYYMSANAEPSAAIVTKVGVSNISIARIPPQSYSMDPYDGCIHRLSPNAAKSYAIEDQGTWDYRLSDKRRKEK